MQCEYWNFQNSEYLTVRLYAQCIVVQCIVHTKLVEYSKEAEFNRVLL